MNTPPAKARRVIYPSPSASSLSSTQSPSSPQSQSPSSFEREDISGYVVMVGGLQQGDKNKYFDVKLNVASGGNVVVRVMVIGSQKTNFLNYMNKPVNIKQVSIPRNRKNNVRFFTEKFGSSCDPCPHKLAFPITPLTLTKIADVTVEMSGFNVLGRLKWLGEMESANNSKVKNAVIVDETGEIVISIWREQCIRVVQDGVVYMISDLTTRMWNRKLKLNTTTQTLFMKKNDDEKLPKVINLAAHQDDSDMCTLVNPDVVSANVEIRRACRNVECRAEFVPKVKDGFPRCPKCGHSNKLTSLRKNVQCFITVDMDGQDTKLLAGERVIDAVPQFKDMAPEDLERALLMMKGKIVVNMDKFLVVSISDVELQYDDDFEEIDWSNDTDLCGLEQFNDADGKKNVNEK